MKKGLSFIFLALVIAGSIFAQEKSAAAKSNWVSGEVTLFGAGIRYERMLTPKLSLGAVAYYSQTFILYGDVGADASVRFYPWGKTFFAGAGLGFHYTEVIIIGSDPWTFGGIGITPEIGWKIDVGNVGGFFLEPGIKMPFTISFMGDERGFQGGLPLIYLGLGWAF